MSKTDKIENYMSSKLEYLDKISDTGQGRGMLARIRRGIGKQPGELPELWGLIFDRLPEDLLGDSEPSFAEWAIYTALTLYALHQQGNEHFMHVKNISLAGAAAQFAAQQEGGEERIIKRLNLVATAVSQNDLAYYLRGVVQLLSNKAIGFDYARLAKEIYMMNFEESANAVKQSWGREFYRILRQVEKNNNDEQ